jgi:VIT1/CCC1 family predicted Fe2+/Mn2+ transporter
MIKEKNPLSDYEISIIKSLYDKKLTKQDIQFKINLFRYLINKKTVNIARITEITEKNLFPNISKHTSEELDKFFKAINSANLETHLSPFINEHKLIIKSREAMISAIASFNSPSFSFSVESFCILSCVAWTSLLQSLAPKFNIKVINDNKNDKQYSSLSYLVEQFTNLKVLTKPIGSNINGIIEQRDSFTHSPENETPINIVSLLQANCFNFNKTIVEHYGQHRGLENVFSIALQMASFKPSDFLAKDSNNNFPYISSIQNFEETLDKEILEHTDYRFNIAILPHSVNKSNQSDFVYIIAPNSEEANESVKIIYKATKTFIDKSENYKNEFQKIINLLKKDYEINRNILTIFIKKHKIKNNEKYTHKQTLGKSISYKYSDDFIKLLKSELNKKK